ncbi:hypothetical protein Y032_0036g3275 [Ancylostoma ceylanicum]|uniref:Uncharacterized protein n=1 Tax=Ancylostoma ceylanicum TaxID=53326 RepID=A0A016UKD9_9BILA|nr:hypothetical protein Y032_0036g3275 [Ancylostoma ceylanicum]
MEDQSTRHEILDERTRDRREAVNACVLAATAMRLAPILHHVVNQHQQVLAMLNCFYANSQLNHQERQILVDFLNRKLDWPHPICTLLYSDTIEEDKDNGVMLRVRRYIELNTSSWSIRLLKTAECLRKVPRFTWAKFYAK